MTDSPMGPMADTKTTTFPVTVEVKRDTYDDAAVTEKHRKLEAEARKCWAATSNQDRARISLCVGESLLVLFAEIDEWLPTSTLFRNDEMVEITLLIHLAGVDNELVDAALEQKGRHMLTTLEEEDDA